MGLIWTITYKAVKKHGVELVIAGVSALLPQAKQSLDEIEKRIKRDMEKWNENWEKMRNGC